MSITRKSMKASLITGSGIRGTQVSLSRPSARSGSASQARAVVQRIVASAITGRRVSATGGR